MTREELFEIINEIEDPKKDSSKLLSNLHYTHFYLMDRYKKLLAGYDLTPIQSNVLGIITYFYPKTASLEEIKEMVLEPNSDVSRTVSRLVEKGIVEKVPNKENKRKVAIKATAKGMDLMRKIETEKKFEKFTADLTTAEAKTFVKVLLKLRS
jgi:DNA-binding MarR family transcriptional regulator